MTNEHEQSSSPSAHFGGVELAARYVEKLRDDYVDDNSLFDPETGATSISEDGSLYVAELGVIIDGIRALHPAEPSKSAVHITPQMIRDTAGWEQIEDELRVTLRQAAYALEAAVDERDALRLALKSAADQLTLVHDDAFKQAAGFGLVTADGRGFSCYQLNMCQTAAGKARAALPDESPQDKEPRQ
jgi:hypothetical protein